MSRAAAPVSQEMRVSGAQSPNSGLVEVNSGGVVLLLLI